MLANRVMRMLASLMVFFVYLSPAAMAKEINPEGFQTPSGYVIHASKSEDYGAYRLDDQFDCLEGGAWKKCGPAHGPFDGKGHVQLEGKIEVASYRPNVEGGSNYLLYLNFKRVVLQAGGRHVAQFRGGREDLGFFRNLLLIDGGDERRWVMFDAFGANRKHPKITVVTQSSIPAILAAFDFQKKIELQGFATLQVSFETNMADILQESEPTLNEVVKLMNSLPKLRLSVEGHTDNEGAPQANKDLSQRRAKAILEYLVRQGVAVNRLQSIGHGQEKPVADNRKAEGRAQNRRVELVKLP